MTRKLLPYEYDLIAALGISKEEYLDFVAKQHVHEDIKDGTLLDIRNEPVSIILAVVGILFQVASILLAPKPPDAAEGAAQTRDQRVGRRTGFNGTQELARYGDAVPLIYTNTETNTSGGVRVSTLLLWSAVLSFGNHQFMRLMMTIGASNIGSIDPERTAIGQFPARDLVTSNIWQYFNADGPTRYRNLLPVGSLNAEDPTREKGYDTTARIAFGDDLSSDQGFSQAFSPTTSDKVGVTGFIPVNAEVMILTSNGDRELKLVDVELTGRGDFWGNNRNRPIVPKGTALTLIIGDTNAALLTDDTAGIAAQDAQRAASSIVDNGALFKAGSAKFRVLGANYDGDGNIETSKLTVDLVCIQKGQMPQLEYNITHWLKAGGSQQTELNNKIAELDRQVQQNESKIAAEKAVLSRGYMVVRVFSGGKATGQLKGLDASSRANIQKEIDKLDNKNAALAQQLEDLKTDVAAIAVAPFHTKGFARIEEAAYASVTKCNVLDLALRFQVYRRLSGRSNVYGSKQRDYGHSPSDNGAKARTAMFVVYYKLNDGDDNYIPYIFCCRGFNEQDVFTYLKLRTPGAPKQFEVRLEPVVDPYTEVRTLTIKGYCYLDPGANATTLNTTRTGNSNLTVYFNGVRREPNDKDYPPFNKNPRDVSEFDLFNYDAYSTSSFSFDNGPEIQITAVNEQVLEAWDSDGNANYDKIYRDLSTFALHVVSGAGTRDLRSVSVWVDQGKRVRTLNEDGTYTSDKPKSSSFAPEIFLDTVLDKDNGIGKYAKIHAVDVQQLGLSKRFCAKNDLCMDGAIADQRSWRQFWSEVAPFSLLELGKIGGRDTLVPALPYNESTGQIRDTQPVAISALFNQGNILQGSLKEEFIDYGASTQDVIVTVLYRDVERDGLFPRNNSVEIRLDSTTEDDAIRETIDASQFVTRRNQAIKLGKFLCNTRRHSRRAIEFQTFPTDSFVAPGAYIYVETTNSEWERVYTGRIEDGGVLNLPVVSTVPSRSDYNVLTYTGDGSAVKQFNNITVSGNTAAELSSRAGDLFVLGREIRNKRVFRVTEVNMEEEGETTIRAVEHPCDDDGLSLIAQGIREPVAGLFKIDGDDE